MDRLASISSLMVKQQKEWGEILTGFETKNKYSVCDESGNEIYLAAEDPGSSFMRWFLKALRPFTLSVLTLQGDLVLQVKRPFRFYFHRLEIYDARGGLLGVVQKKFSILRRIYSVMNPQEQEVCQLFGPILHPWTFEIKKDGMVFGKITKKWSGLMKEGFTDADNFGVTFEPSCDYNLKAILLGAVFLIDFVHFENKGKN